MKILHFTSKTAFKTAAKEGYYAPESLTLEGFIHCSTVEQVLDAAERYAKGQEEWILLWIEQVAVTEPIRYENLLGGSDLFPHIYGPLNLEAIIEVFDFERDTTGKFRLPDGIQ